MVLFQTNALGVEEKEKKWDDSGMSLFDLLIYLLLILLLQKLYLNDIIQLMNKTKSSSR